MFPGTHMCRDQTNADTCMERKNHEFLSVPRQASGLCSLLINPALATTENTPARQAPLTGEVLVVSCYLLSCIRATQVSLLIAVESWKRVQTGFENFNSDKRRALKRSSTKSIKCFEPLQRAGFDRPKTLLFASSFRTPEATRDFLLDGDSIALRSMSPKSSRSLVAVSALQLFEHSSMAPARHIH